MHRAGRQARAEAVYYLISSICGFSTGSFSMNFSAFSFDSNIATNFSPRKYPVTLYLSIEVFLYCMKQEQAGTLSHTDLSRGVYQLAEG
jgi:hypothetical protein